MPRRVVAFALGGVVAGLGAGAGAQPMEAVEVPMGVRAGPVPAEPGVGAQAMAVRAFFGGFPSDLRDARDLLDGRSLTPSFDVWCGTVPYVDFANGTVADSMGREAPTVLCLPFLDPERRMPSHTCRALPNVPDGGYYQGGGLALRVQGLVALRAAGEFTFALGHDDGVGLSVGGLEVVEYREPTASRVDRRVVRAPAPGLYPFTLEWYDTVGGALVDWYVADGDAREGPLDARFRLVPTEDLHPSGALGCTARCERCGGDAPLCDYAAGRCVRCRGDADCGPCALCRDARCVALAEVPGADGGAAGVPDAAAPDGGGGDAGDDAPAPDVYALDAPSPAATGGGCSCRAGRGAAPSRGAGVALALLAWALVRRRTS